MRSLQQGRMLAAAALATAACREGRLQIEPLALPVAETSQSADPALAVEPGSGELLLSWAGGDERAWTLLLARSADGGRSWSSPATVAGGPAAPDEIHPHGESSPRLVAGPGGRVVLVWPNSIRVKGRKWPATMLRLARSSDGGASWSTPISLNDDSIAAPASHQFHGAAWRGDSGLVVAWLDERHATAADPAGGAVMTEEPDATIYAAASPDFGRSWGPNARLWGAVCPCCRVSLLRLPNGSLTAAWRQHFPGDVRDVVVAPVAPEPPAPIRVHADQWVYPGCPHSGPAAAASADGAIHTAWYSGKPGASGVFYRRVGAAGPSGPLVKVFTADQVLTAHPAIAPLADGGALVAYDIGPDGERLVRLVRISAAGRPVAAATVAGSEGGAYPQLALVSASAAVLAYTVTVGDVRLVKAARVRIPG